MKSECAASKQVLQPLVAELVAGGGPGQAWPPPLVRLQCSGGQPHRRTTTWHTARGIWPRWSPSPDTAPSPAMEEFTFGSPAMEPTMDEGEKVTRYRGSSVASTWRPPLTPYLGE